MTEYEGMIAAMKAVSPAFQATQELYRSGAIQNLYKGYMKILGIQNTSEIMNATKIMSANLKAISSINLTSVYQVQNQLKGLAAFQESLYKSCGFSKGQALKVVQAMSQYDVANLTKIIREKVETIELSEETDFEQIVEDVAETFIAEKEEVVPEKTANVVEEKKKISWFAIVTIIGLYLGILNDCLGIIDFFKPQESQPIVIVNNYFRDDIGLDVEELNAYNYRIICKSDVKPRIKADNSSQVTGHLNIGQVVMITDKYKKWIEVTWKNEQGELCSGWIQNWKVTEFKQ